MVWGLVVVGEGAKDLRSLALPPPFFLNYYDFCAAKAIII
jgi:hypothetical protein